MFYILQNSGKILIPFVILILYIVIGCNENKVPDDKDLALTLTNISKGRQKFYSNGDSAVWINHTAENFISINDDGSAETKNELYNDLRGSSPHPDYFDSSGEYYNVKLYKTGNMAVLTFRTTDIELFPNDTIYSPLQRTEIYSFLDGRWQIIASQVTPIAENHITVLHDYPTNMIKDTGIYLWYNGKADTISINDHKLYSHITGGTKEQLFAINDSVTILKTDLGKAIFHHDARGKTYSYEYVTADGQSLNARKIR